MAFASEFNLAALPEILTELWRFFSVSEVTGKGTLTVSLSL
jgi:hypothetical protein